MRRFTVTRYIGPLLDVSTVEADEVYYPNTAIVEFRTPHQGRRILVLAIPTALLVSVEEQVS